MLRLSVYFFLSIMTMLSGVTYTLAASGADEPLSGSVSSSATTVFDPKAEGCERGYDVADAPARAFRDHAGIIHLIATNHHNRALLGQSFDKLTHPCKMLFRAHQKVEAAAYDDYGWLTSFYTSNGTDVFALVHNELHAFERKDLCPSGDHVNCIEYSITGALSKDGGQTFTRQGPPALIASLPYAFNGKNPHLSGYSNPSNIIELGSKYYALIASLDPKYSHSGICVIRTSTLSDARSWRGWDGKGFNIQFTSPYGTNAVTKPETCQPVGNGNLYYALGSVGRDRKSGIFIAVMRRNQWEHHDASNPAGVYITTSRNLLNWSKPSLLIADNTVDPTGQTEMLYPSLIDPNAADRNFTDLTSAPLLFTVDSVKGKSFDSHKLVYRQVKID